MGRWLSFHPWVRPLSLGPNSLCYSPHTVGDSGRGAGEQEARGQLPQPSHPRRGRGVFSLASWGAGKEGWVGLMKGVIPLPSL